MSKPISRASTALGDAMTAAGVFSVSGSQTDRMAIITVRAFLEDASSEGRFDNRAIEALLEDLK